MKRVILFIQFLIFLNNIFAILITDDVKRSIEIKNTIKRIISLSPAHTEIIYFLGAQDKLIAVSENCDFPPDTKNKKKAGTFLNPDIETIVKLKPDIVISGGGIQKKAIKKLEELKIGVIVLYPENINGIIKNMELLCKLLDGNCNKIKEFKSHLKVKNTKKKIKTYLELWGNPEMAIGGSSFINDIVEFAGGENIFKNTISEYPKISKEEILKKSPEVIILFYEPENNNFILKKFKDKIYILQKEKQDIFLRPGPRIIEAINFLYRIYKSMDYEK